MFYTLTLFKRVNSPEKRPFLASHLNQKQKNGQSKDSPFFWFKRVYFIS